MDVLTYLAVVNGPLAYVLGLGAAAVGLLVCLCGYRLFELWNVLIGGVVGASLGMAVCQVIAGRDAGATINAYALIGGILGALLFWVGVRVMTFLMGATLGLIVGALFGYTAGGEAGAVVLGLVAAVALGYVALRLRRIIVILSTASFGAVFAAYGLRLAFSALYSMLLERSFGVALPVKVVEAVIEVLVPIGFFCVGVVIQLRDDRTGVGSGEPGLQGTGTRRIASGRSYWRRTLDTLPEPVLKTLRTSEVMTVLNPGDMCTVLGEMGDYYRVSLRDGRIGYVARDAIVPAPSQEAATVHTATAASADDMQ